MDQIFYHDKPSIRCMQLCNLPTCRQSLQGRKVFLFVFVFSGKNSLLKSYFFINLRKRDTQTVIAVNQFTFLGRRQRLGISFAKFHTCTSKRGQLGRGGAWCKGQKAHQSATD